MIMGPILNLVSFSFVIKLAFAILVLVRVGWGMGGGGGWGQIKFKDHLSPAKAEIRAELGKNKSRTLGLLISAS